MAEPFNVPVNPIMLGITVSIKCNFNIALVLFLRVNN